MLTESKFPDLDESQRNELLNEAVRNAGHIMLLAFQIAKVPNYITGGFIDGDEQPWEIKFGRKGFQIPTPAGSLLQERPAAEELYTMQIDVPLGVVTVSFEEIEMYGGFAEWLRAKKYIGKDEDGEDETEDDITHWAGPKVTRAHYAALVENAALLAKLQEAAASQPLELLGVPPTLSNPVYLPGGAEVTVEEMLQKIEGSLILSYGKQGDEAYNHLYSSVTYAVQVLRKQLAPAGLALSAASPSTIGGTPHARYPLGVSKQDLLDAANMVEGKGMKREASMMRSLIDEVEGLQESAAPSTIGGSGGAKLSVLAERLKSVFVSNMLGQNGDIDAPWLISGRDSYSIRQLAKEVADETEFGIERLAGLVSVAADMMARNKCFREPAAPAPAEKAEENPLAVVHEVLNDWLDQNESTDFDENDVASFFGMLGTAGYSIVRNPTPSEKAQ